MTVYLYAYELLIQPHDCQDSINMILFDLIWMITYNAEFLPARRSKRGTCYGNVAGWLGVCLSHAGSVSKRLNLS